jgi:hypothetical protein
VISLSSVFGDSWLKFNLKRDKKYIPFDVHKALIYGKMLGDNKCIMKLIINVDPHIDKIPKVFINWAMKSVVGMALNKFKKKTEKMPDTYKTLM